MSVDLIDKKIDSEEQKKFIALIKFLRNEFGINLSTLLNFDNDDKIDFVRLITICIAYAMIKNPSERITGIYRESCARINRMTAENAEMAKKLKEIKKKLEFDFLNL